MSVTAAAPAPGKESVPPPINGDFYRIADLLDPQERAVVKRVRDFMETEVAPIIEDYWGRDQFPHEIIPKLVALDVHIAGVGYQGCGSAGGSWLLNGVLAMELARIDSSIATFRGVHTGLSAGSIYLCGDESQKSRWLPTMMSWEKIGSFGLTEPLVGSATSGGMTTSCRREDDTWILNGQKKWIGNSTFSDINVIWARDEASGQVKGFVVEKGNPGFSVEKIKTKMALRVVQNGLMTLKDCRVPEADRLQNGNSFARTQAIRQADWRLSTCPGPARAHARQLGGDATACPVARPGPDGRRACVARQGLRHGQVSRDSRLCAGTAGRERYLARKSCRSFCTREMNTLIVGKAITGLSAFV